MLLPQMRLVVASACGLSMLACAQPTSPQQPSPRIIRIATPHVSLRTSAWVELHTWIAAVARSVVDLVTEAPLAGKETPVGVVLATRGGGCLSKHHNEAPRVHDARIMDCVLVRAAIGLKGQSEIARDPAIDCGKWAALVTHAVATAVTAWEPAHESALSGTAEKAMPELMTWLAREWPSRLHGESAASFAKRYAAAP